MKPLTYQRRTIAVAAAALTAGTLLLAASPASAAPAGTATTAAREQAVANKAIVRHVYDQLFNRGNLAVVDRYFRADYIQHNPALPNGTAALKSLVSGIRAAHPKAGARVYRVLAEGDLVLVHSNVVLDPGTRGTATVDIFRLERGKIAEHWDSNQAVPDATASGNDMFSTLSPTRTRRGAPGLTVANKKLVTTFFSALGQDRDVTAFDRYVTGPYYQHNTLLPNGTDAAKGLFDQFVQSPFFDVSVKRVVADGDLVAIHSHYHLSNDNGLAVVDIFRVLDGKIVEHWDVIQAVPEAAANDNTMF